MVVGFGSALSHFSNEHFITIISRPRNGAHKIQIHTSHKGGKYTQSGNPHGEETPRKTQTQSYGDKLSQQQIRVETACAQRCAHKSPPQANLGEHQQTNPDDPDSEISQQDYKHPDHGPIEPTYPAVWQMTCGSPGQTHP